MKRAYEQGHRMTWERAVEICLERDFGITHRPGRDTLEEYRRRNLPAGEAAREWATSTGARTLHTKRGNGGQIGFDFMFEKGE